MTTDREQIIAAAKEAGIHRRSTPIGTTEMFCWLADIESLYAIAFEAGRQAEREACAMEAEFYIKHSTIAKSIAEDIRARSTK